MYDINLKSIKGIRFIWYIFIILAVIFIVVAVSMAVFNYMIVKNFTTEATSYKYEFESHYDSDENLLYTPVYYYSVGGKEYTCKSSISSSSKRGEERKIIHYYTDEPDKCIDGVESMMFIYIPFTIISIIFIVIGIIGLKANNKKVKIAMELNQTGKLVKRIPCRLENSNVSVNGNPCPWIVIDYVLPDGTTVKLHGSPIIKNKFQNDGFADLVIDEANPTNYFVDFSINRLEGNRKEDYYTLPGGETQEDQFVSAFDI